LMINTEPKITRYTFFIPKPLCRRAPEEFIDNCEEYKNG